MSYMSPISSQFFHFLFKITGIVKKFVITHKLSRGAVLNTVPVKICLQKLLSKAPNHHQKTTFFILNIKIIKKQYFSVFGKMSYNSTQKSYIWRKSIIYVEKSYFEGLKCPINAENVLFRKKSYMNEISL